MLRFIPIFLILGSCSAKTVGALTPETIEPPKRDTVTAVRVETVRDTVVKTVTLTVTEVKDCNEAPKPLKRWQVRKQNKRFKDSLNFELSKLKIELRRQRDTIALLKKQIRPQERTERVKARAEARSKRTDIRQGQKTKRQGSSWVSWRSVLFVWGVLFLLIVLLIIANYVKKLFPRFNRADSREEQKDR